LKQPTFAKFKSSTHIHGHDNLGGWLEEKQIERRNITQDKIPFQQCIITYSRGVLQNQYLKIKKRKLQTYKCNTMKVNTTKLAKLLVDS
jgi:hypothetical protein